MKKLKTKRCKSLLALLGGDPLEAVPASLREAQDMQGGEPDKRQIMPRCPMTGKVSFSSESQAKQAARHRLNRGSNVSKLRVYRCEHCAQFHFSSSFKL